MKIGPPKEIKNNGYRVGLTPVAEALDIPYTDPAALM